MNEENKKNLRLVVEALRQNEKKAIGYMRDGCGGRCCLCVMEETMVKEYPDSYENYDDEQTDSIFPNNILFRKFFGFNYMDTVFTIAKVRDTLSIHNDGNSHLGATARTHKEIADAIEIEFDLK